MNCDAHAFAKAFARRDIPCVAGLTIPTARDFYWEIVGCAKPPSIPPTNNELLGLICNRLVGQTFKAGGGTVSWRRGRDDPSWFYAKLNGGFVLEDGAFLRLYLSLRRSYYTTYMEYAVGKLAEAGVKAETKVSLNEGRWDTYDGATIYLPPESLAAALDVLWQLPIQAFVQPPDLKPARQLEWRGERRPVFLAQEPDVPNESFHNRLAHLLVKAIELAKQRKVLGCYPFVNGKRSRGLELIAHKPDEWQEIVRLTLIHGGVESRAIYLNRQPSPVNKRVREALGSVIGHLY